jgi:hypothetical protein
MNRSHQNESDDCVAAASSYPGTLSYSMNVHIPYSIHSLNVPASGSNMATRNFVGGYATVLPTVETADDPARLKSAVPNTALWRFGSGDGTQLHCLGSGLSKSASHLFLYEWPATVRRGRMSLQVYFLTALPISQRLQQSAFEPTRTSR